MPRQVLIDADITLYQIASSNEIPTRFDNGLWVLWADEAKCKQDFDEALQSIVEKTRSDDYLLCLTSPNNFRKDILPSYKGNRKETRKPMMLPFLRQYIIENYKYDMRDGLEGDDLLGIYGTDPNSTVERIIYSADKDVKTLPAKLWNDDFVLVNDNSLEDANRNWFMQTLTGDTTDGYKGLVGCGPVAAAKILDKDCSWEAVVAAYEKKGLTADDALQQAQVARILRYEDYDLETDTLKVWKP